MAKKKVKKVALKDAKKKPNKDKAVNGDFTQSEIKAMQEIFVYNYIENGFKNGRQAAIDAGYSERSAAVQASRLLTNVNVQKKIAEKRIELEAELDKALNISKTQVLAKWAKIGLKVSDASHRDQLKATELIAKHIGMFNEAGKGDGQTDRKDVSNRVRETIAKMRRGRPKNGKRSPKK